MTRDIIDLFAVSVPGPNGPIGFRDDFSTDESEPNALR